jgi:hypothetical protein
MLLVTRPTSAVNKVQLTFMMALRMLLCDSPATVASSGEMR